MMETARRLRRVLAVGAAALVMLSAAGCSNDGPKIDYTVAATATDGGTRDTAATADPDDVASGWAEVEPGSRPSVPDGQLEVLVSANYLLGEPTIRSVRGDDDAWTVHINAYDLEGCNMPAVITSVTFLLHVTADAAPATLGTAIDMEHGCPR